MNVSWGRDVDSVGFPRENGDMVSLQVSVTKRRVTSLDLALPLLCQQPSGAETLRSSPSQRHVDESKRQGRRKSLCTAKVERGVRGLTVIGLTFPSRHGHVIRQVGEGRPRGKCERGMTKPAGSQPCESGVA